MPSIWPRSRRKSALRLARLSWPPVSRRSMPPVCRITATVPIPTCTRRWRGSGWWGGGVTASGPAGGKLFRADGRKPLTVGIVHCVGSRDENTHRWCSRVCCMYSLKLAHLIKEHTGAEVFNFYIDIRTPGKGFEEFYQKLLSERVHFIRGRVAEVTEWELDPSEAGNS